MAFEYFFVPFVVSKILDAKGFGGNEARPAKRTDGGLEERFVRLRGSGAAVNGRAKKVGGQWGKRDRRIPNPAGFDYRCLAP
eukprot:767677-Hanusia_phi.AAC.3